MKNVTAEILAFPAHSARTGQGLRKHAWHPLAVLLGVLSAVTALTGYGQRLQPEPHATPVAQGSFVSDPAIPTLISPSIFRSEYFVLNQDFSLLTHSSVDSSLNGTCAAPSGFNATSSTPRTFVNDTQNAYFTGQSSANANAAVSGFSFINTGLCQPVKGPPIAGGTPTYAFTSNDVYHARLYTLSGFNGTVPDTLTVEVNLNNALSGGNTVTQLKTINLDTGAQYTSLVTDTLAGASGVSMTAVTELKTATSPGNLWIYNPSSGAVYKILGPGGVPLPAVTSFIIPAQTNAGGSLLVLVNQDNLTAANLSNPPLDATPFTIIDLGQLVQAFSVQTTGGTITLPFVTQVPATTPYFAMLGAAYNPVTRLIYAVVGGGSASGVTANVVSYDPFQPGSPRETVVADISNIPFSYGAYPQLALSAAAGTLQILPQGSSALYSVDILGTGNSAMAVQGSTFPDSNFQPTFIAANTLLGETYIASASGQVDILKNSAATPAATLTLNGLDIGVTSQSYNLQATALYAVDDSALRAAPVTVTATPHGSGTAFTVAAGAYANFSRNPGNIPITFPALGVYTLVASLPATANYPAITSNPINVTVASNYIAGVYPTLLAITAPSNPTTTAVNAFVTLSGSTYAPTGSITVTDANGHTVGSTTFNGGPLVQPTTVALTLAQGSNTLTATYSGDAQNAPTTSPAVTLVVGTQVTPTLALTVANSTSVGSSVSGNVKFTSTTTNAPTGSVTISGLLAGSTTPITLATVTAAQAFTSSGANYSFTAPAAGSYFISASYPGDSNYATATSVNTSLSVFALDTSLTLTPPASASTNTVFQINIKLASATSTQTPSGSINVTAQLAGTTTSTNIGIIDPSQAYAAAGGTNLTAQLPTAGIWTINASFLGDQNFRSSTATAMLTVSSATAVATTLKIAAPANVAVNTPYTAVVKLTAASTLTNGPSGLVTLVVTSSTGAIVSTINTTAASAFLGTSGYSASIPAATAPGTYTLTASYAGDTNYAASSTTSTVIVGSTALTATSLSIKAPSPVAFNTSYNAVVTLTPATASTPAPTGNVLLTISTAGYATVTLASIPTAQALAAGGYAVSIPANTGATSVLTATYAGDTNYAAASPATTTVTVTAATSLTIKVPTSAVSLNTSFNAVVTLTSGSAAASVPAATGNIMLTSSTAGFPTVTIATFTAAQASAAGGYTVTIPATAVSTSTLTATYAGDSNYQSSTAAAQVTVSALKATTTAISVDSAAFASVGTPINVLYGLAVPAGSSPAPTGTVVLTETYGGTTVTLGTVTADRAQSTSSPQASFTPTKSGAYTLTASYTGDANYQPSTISRTVTVSSLPVPNVSIAGPSRGTVGLPLTFSIGLSDAVTGKKIVAAGTFTITSTLAGAAGPSATISAPTGQGTVMLTFPSTGTYSVSATYSGDTAYAPGASTALNAPIDVRVYTASTLPTFTLAPADPSLGQTAPGIMINGSDVNVSFLLTSVNGYRGVLAISTYDTNNIADPKQNALIGAFPVQLMIMDGYGHPIGDETGASIDLTDPITPFTIKILGGAIGKNKPWQTRPENGPLLCILLGGLTLAGMRRGKSTARIARLTILLVTTGAAACMISGCSVFPGTTYTIHVVATDTINGITQTSQFIITAPSH